MHAQVLTQNNSAYSSTQSNSLAAWKVEISAANNAFIHGQYARASSHYEEALILAQAGVRRLVECEVSIDLLADAEQYIVALVVSRHNLADLFLQAGQLSEVIEHLCAAHETVFELLHHSSSNIAALAQRHFRVTYLELLAFTKNNGQHPRIQQTLLLTQYVCVCCRETVEH